MKNQRLVLHHPRGAIKNNNWSYTMENNNGYTEYGYRGNEEVRKLSVENKILKQTVYDLQEQLQEAYKRIKELIAINSNTS